MAGHPQTTPRGLWAGDMQIGTFTLDSNSSGVTIDGKLKLNGQKHISANSTGFVFDVAAAKPTTRSAAKWAFYTNSTGVNGILINTTGTTWKWANVTTVAPT